MGFTQASPWWWTTRATFYRDLRETPCPLPKQLRNIDVKKMIIGLAFAVAMTTGTVAQPLP